MQKRKITIWFALFGVLTALFLAAAVWLRQDIVGLSINITVVMIMAGILVRGMGLLPIWKNGIRSLVSAGADLQNAAQRIRTLAEEPQADIESMLDADGGLFENEALQAAYLSHRRELDRLYREQTDFRYADVGDFINQELLGHIADASFNDLVSGTMTGLGILGTFVGLMFGLQDFDPTTAESMMETITPLIDGIKIAFLTSIFGVVYSLAFNLLYRVTMGEAADALDDFLDAYYKHVLPRPENDGFTKLIQYQQSQSQSMAQFAEQLSLTVAEALGSSVVPTFERIEKTIGQLAENLAKTQDQNMERIAADFVASFDKAMGNQMQNLGENIKVLCDMQESAATKMQDTIEQIARTGECLGTVTTDLQGSISSMESYLRNVEQMQGSLKDEYASLVQTFSRANEDIQKQHDTLLKILELEEDSLESMEKLQQTQAERLEEEKQAAKQYREDMRAFYTEVQNIMKESVEEQTAQLRSSMERITQTQKQIITDLETCCQEIQKKLEEASVATIDTMDTVLDEQIKQIRNNTEQIENAQKLFVLEMSAASSKLSASAGQISSASADLTTNLDKAMSHTYKEIDKQLAEIVSHLSGTITDIRDITEKVPRMLNMSTEQMQSSTRQYLSELSASQNKLLEALQKIANRADGKRKE